MAIRATISKGPSKFDLMVSLFEGNPTPRHRVTFTVSPQNTIETRFARDLRVSITCIEQEDGSGESWNFKGYVQKDELSPSKIVDGYYSSATRKGYIFLPEPISHI